MKRIENKYIIIGRDNYNKFLKFIIAHGFKEIFYKRKINSVYFDFKNFSLFDFSEEGLASKDKIRLRFYGSKLNLEDANLEVKTSNAYSKIKLISKFKSLDNMESLKIKNIKKNIYLKKLIPTVKVSYERQYFLSKKFGRVTLDKNIFYEKAKWKKYPNELVFSKKMLDNRNVCEHKIENKVIIDDVFPISNIRFSKYCEAVKKVYQRN